MDVIVTRDVIATPMVIGITVNIAERRLATGDIERKGASIPEKG